MGKQKSPAGALEKLKALIDLAHEEKVLGAGNFAKALEEVRIWAFKGYDSRSLVDDLSWLTQWAVENINAQPGARIVEVVAKVIDKLREDLREAEDTIQHLRSDLDQTMLPNPTEMPLRAPTIDEGPLGGPMPPSKPIGEPKEAEPPPCSFCGDQPLVQKLYKYPPDKLVPPDGPSKWDDAWEPQKIIPVACPICGIKRGKLEKEREKPKPTLVEVKLGGVSHELLMASGETIERLKNQIQEDKKATEAGRAILQLLHVKDAQGYGPKITLGLENETERYLGTLDDDLGPIEEADTLPELLEELGIQFAGKRE